MSPPIGASRVSRYAQIGDVIPDSVVLNYDAQAIANNFNDGDVVNTWPDEIGNMDATGGNAVFRTNEFNGYPAVDFDSTSYVIGDGSEFSTPITVLTVLDMDSSGDWSVPHFGNGRCLWLDGEGPWELYNDNSIPGSSNPDINLLTFWDDGNSNAAIREDGSQTGSGSSGSRSFLAELGGWSDNSRWWDGPICEVVVHDKVLSGSELSNEEQRLADKWGITI